MKNEITEIVYKLKSFRDASDDLSDEILDVMTKALDSMSLLTSVIELADFENEDVAAEAGKKVNEAIEQMGVATKDAFSRIDRYQKALKEHYLPSIKLIANINKGI